MKRFPFTLSLLLVISLSTLHAMEKSTHGKKIQKTPYIIKNYIEKPATPGSNKKLINKHIQQNKDDMTKIFKLITMLSNNMTDILNRLDNIDERITALEEQIPNKK